MDKFLNCAKKLVLVKDMSDAVDFDLIDRHVKSLEYRENTKNNISDNLNIFDIDIFKDTKKILEEECEKFLKNGYPDVEFSNLIMTNSWANVTNPGDSHHTHLHPFSVVSAVLFLDDNPSNYNLHLESQVAQIPHYIEQASYYVPISRLVGSVGVDITTTNLKNHLVLFLSNTGHFVKTVENDTPRRSISFNTFWKGVTGPNEHVLGSYIF
jgi:uncharacterized protein (TIGR02466 family)